MTSDTSSERDFRRLWAAQAVSDFGARITREGLPMMAVISLAATPGELGLLAAVAGAPALLVGLGAGGFVDRGRRRRILVTADLLRAGVLVTLPVAAWLHALSLPHVFAAAALVAGASALFDIADHAYLPTVVLRERITAANARLSATESVAEMGGPALAGLLFQWLTAPIAVAVNAATYVASAMFLATIKAPEPPADPHPRRGWLDGVRTGTAAAWAEPRVRPLLAMAVASGAFGGVFSALYVVFALRTLLLTPALLGLAIATGGAGALVGSLIAQPLAHRVGPGPALLTCAFVSVASALIIPLSPPGPAAGMSFLIISQILGDAFGTAALILSASLRQLLLPQRLLGRTGAAFQAIAGGAALIGALAGGILGQGLGVRSALLFAAVGLSLAPLLGLASPLRRMRNFPVAVP